MFCTLSFQFVRYVFLFFVFIYSYCYVRSILTMGSYKSLARPKRNQSTATKIGIYSAYSPRSSIHFLARCSNFCKSLKKFRNFFFQAGLCSSNNLCIGRKMTNYQFFFSFQVTGGSSTEPDPGNRVGYHNTGAQIGQFLLGCKFPVIQGHRRARTRRTW